MIFQVNSTQEDWQNGQPRKDRIISLIRPPFIVLAFAALLGNLFVPAILGQFHFSNVTCGFFTGLLVGQPVTIAIWILFDPAERNKKLAIGSSVAFVLASGLVLPLQVWEGVPTPIAAIVIMASAVLPIFYAMTLLLLRRVLNPTILNTLSDNRTPSSSQFRIRNLFLLMMIVAASCLLIRFQIPIDAKRSNSDEWILFVRLLSLVWLAVLTSLYSWVIFTGVVEPTWQRVSLGIVLTIVGPIVYKTIPWLLERESLLTLLIETNVYEYAFSCGLILVCTIVGLIVRMIATRSFESDAASTDRH